jgi:mono/diheme cytochrome c family protein
MKFALPLLGAALVCAIPFALNAYAASEESAAPKGDAVHGRQVYVSAGCYQCHGYEGTTSGPGPRLAPDPQPYDQFSGQLRHPRARMPIYPASILSDQDVADIYAYMLAQPKAKPASDIPLLNQ